MNSWKVETLEDTLEMMEYLIDEIDILNVSAAVNDTLQISNRC